MKTILYALKIFTVQIGRIDYLLLSKIHHYGSKFHHKRFTHTLINNAEHIERWDRLTVSFLLATVTYFLREEFS